MDPASPAREVDSLEPGFLLCVSRLLPYKNVDAVIEAVVALPGVRLVVVGTGPDERRLRHLAGRNVRFVGAVADGELRWLYANCVGLVAASYEDYGLTPLEAAAFGKPAAVLRWGGFLDTVVEHETGLFFDRPEPNEIRAALHALEATSWKPEVLLAQADRYSEARFIRRLREIVAEEAEAAASGSS
jgi:glycosyltransferase involved in cell wall biosynthesis